MSCINVSCHVWHLVVTYILLYIYQYTYIYYKVLQYAAVCISVNASVSSAGVVWNLCIRISQMNEQVCCRVLQCVAACCSLLQCVAVCCSALQCVAQRICPYRIWMGHFAYQGVTTRVKASCQVWNYQEYQCAAVCCSVLQCVLQCVAQCVSVCTRLHRWRVFLGTCVCRVYVSACYSVYVIIQCMSLFSVYHYSVYVIIRCMSLFSVCRYSVYVVIQCMSLIGVCRYSERVCRHTQVCVCQL